MTDITLPREQWNLIDPEGAVRATEDTCIKAWARINGYKPTVEGLLGYEQQGWRVRSALTQQAEPTDDEQQSAFEKWLSRVCPSGDVESVHAQWLASSDYLDLFEAATPPSPSAETAHRQGCDALGGYGNGIGPCTCGAQPSGEVLTKEEIRAVEHSVDWNTSREVVEFARAIERATLAKIGARHG